MEIRRRLRGVAAGAGEAALPCSPTRCAAPGRADTGAAAGPLRAAQAGDAAGDPRRAMLWRRALLRGVTFGELAASGDTVAARGEPTAPFSRPPPGFSFPGAAAPPPGPAGATAPSCGEKCPSPSDQLGSAPPPPPQPPPPPPPPPPPAMPAPLPPPELSEGAPPSRWAPAGGCLTVSIPIFGHMVEIKLDHLP